MIRERSQLDAIASEIHVTGQSIALDLETYGTSEDKTIRKDETLDPWRGEIRLLSLHLPDRVPWLIDLRATGYGLGELGKVLEATEVIGHHCCPVISPTTSAGYDPLFHSSRTVSS